MPSPILLVAEDNDLDAMLLERLIEHCGSVFQMVRVRDGEAAIDYLQGAGEFSDRAKHPPADLLLLDLKMPRKDGFEVLKWRRENPASARVPVVVFSASYLPADVERAYYFGASSYVVKPSDPGRLERFVKALQVWWSGFNITEGHE